MQRNTDSNFIDNEGSNLKKRTDQIQVEPRSSKAHTQGKKLTSHKVSFLIDVHLCRRMSNPGKEFGVRCFLRFVTVVCLILTHLLNRARETGVKTNIALSFPNFHGLREITQ